MVDLDRCDICEAELTGGSHYHCGRCRSLEETSMLGHHVQFSDGGWGFTCDPENAARSVRRG